MTFEVVRSNIKKGNLNEANRLVDEVLKNKKISKEELIQTHLLKSEILNYQSNYKKSLETTKIAMQKSLELKNKILIVDSILAKVTTLSLLGELTAAEDCVQTCFDHISLKGKKTKEIQKRISSIYNMQGSLNYKRGEMKRAFLLYQKSLGFFEKIDDKVNIASVRIGIGDIFNCKGEIRQALNNYEASLNIYDSLGFELEVVEVLNRISRVYQVTGNLEDALIYYKVALSRAEKNENQILAASILYNLISLLIEWDLINEAKEYLDKLHSIQQENEYQIINLRHKIAQGIILNCDKRLVSRMKAQEIFREISEAEIIDYEIFILAMFNLLETLLFEFGLTGNGEVLDEVKSLLLKLQQIANKQNSYSLLAKTSLLESKLALLEMNFEKAAIELSNALTIAQTKELTSLAILISLEQDIFIQQKNKWKEVIQDEIPLKNRIEIAHMENLFEFMVDNKFLKSTDIKQEYPILLMVNSEGGMNLFTNLFDKNIKIDSFLVSSFLSAIDSFSKEMFASTGSIETIKHQDYTILIKSIDKLSFSYVYKGHSYHAIQKLEEFIKKIMINKEIVSKFEDLYLNINGLDDSTAKKLDSYSKSIFLDGSKVT